MAGSRINLRGSIFLSSGDKDLLVYQLDKFNINLWIYNIVNNNIHYVM